MKSLSANLVLESTLAFTFLLIFCGLIATQLILKINLTYGGELAEQVSVN